MRHRVRGGGEDRGSIGHSLKKKKKASRSPACASAGSVCPVLSPVPPSQLPGDSPPHAAPTPTTSNASGLNCGSVNCSRRNGCLSPHLRVEGFPVTVRHQVVASGWQVDGFRHQSSGGNQRICVFLSVELSGQGGRVQGEGGQRGRVVVPQGEIPVGGERGSLSVHHLQVAPLLHRRRVLLHRLAGAGSCWTFIAGGVSISLGFPFTDLKRKS